jgi:hypothetical protein
MNSSGGKTPSTARPPAYKANALAIIRNELSPFDKLAESSSSQQSPQPSQNQQVSSSLPLRNASTVSTLLSLQSPSPSQNIDRGVLLIRQMLSQGAVNGIEVSPSLSFTFFSFFLYQQLKCAREAQRDFTLIFTFTRENRKSWSSREHTRV